MRVDSQSRLPLPDDQLQLRGSAHVFTASQRSSVGSHTFLSLSSFEEAKSGKLPHHFQTFLIPDTFLKQSIVDIVPNPPYSTAILVP